MRDLANVLVIRVKLFRYFAFFSPAAMSCLLMPMLEAEFKLHIHWFCSLAKQTRNLITSGIIMHCCGVLTQ